MDVTFGVLGPVAAWADGEPVTLGGPRHRAVLARLLVARRRVVPAATLVADLWDEPPDGALAAVRTFVAALRRALEPERPPRSPARLLVTEGPGYALKADDDAVDAWRFEAALRHATGQQPDEAARTLEGALGWWRGPAFADVAAEPWARAERARLTELQLGAVEQLAGARLGSGAAGSALADLDAHVTDHPWREEGWRLLALALYRAGRQADALEVLRRARSVLLDHLGLDPGPALRRLEADVLAQAPHLQGEPTARTVPGTPSSARGLAAQVWNDAATAYDEATDVGARARLESTVGLLRSLAVTGGRGLLSAREHRVAAIAAADELGDVELTARVIGAYDVPAIWTRVDDDAQARGVVDAAEHALAALPASAEPALRARLLATVAVETRGSRSARGPQAARLAERIARDLDDPALLAFALNGTWMQLFTRAGLSAERAQVGRELVSTARRAGLLTYEALGHMVGMQSASALDDVAAANAHADRLDDLSAAHELPLIGVFTTWYRAMRRDADDAPLAEVEAAYRAADARLEGAGMPGMRGGLLALALLCARVRRGAPTPDDGLDAGPFAPWVTPWRLLARGRRDEAREALRRCPDPPPDLLLETLWVLMARAAVELDLPEVAARAAAALRPARAEVAGAGSGVLTLGPVAPLLTDLGT